MSVNKCSPVFASHRKVLPSSLAEASRRESGLKSERFDVGGVPGQRAQLAPVATSQILIVLSLLLEASSGRRD